MKSWMLAAVVALLVVSLWLLGWPQTALLLAVVGAFGIKIYGSRKPSGDCCGGSCKSKPLN